MLFCIVILFCLFDAWCWPVLSVYLKKCLFPFLTSRLVSFYFSSYYILLIQVQRYCHSPFHAFSRSGWTGGGVRRLRSQTLCTPLSKPIFYVLPSLVINSYNYRPYFIYKVSIIWVHVNTYNFAKTKDWMSWFSNRNVSIKRKTFKSK